jgi:hypothetical protein
MAAKITDPEARRAMLEIAENYEHIADRAEVRRQDERPCPRSSRRWHAHIHNRNGLR